MKGFRKENILKPTYLNHAVAAVEGFETIQCLD